MKLLQYFVAIIARSPANLRVTFSYKNDPRKRFYVITWYWAPYIFLGWLQFPSVLSGEGPLVFRWSIKWVALLWFLMRATRVRLCTLGWSALVSCFLPLTVKRDDGDDGKRVRNNRTCCKTLAGHKVAHKKSMANTTTYSKLRVNWSFFQSK